MTLKVKVKIIHTEQWLAAHHDWCEYGDTALTCSDLLRTFWQVGKLTSQADCASLLLRHQRQKAAVGWKELLLLIVYCLIGLISTPLSVPRGLYQHILALMIP